jgi:L,D-transpeptidase catalytic domain/Putative peptidoglycan binding domain
MAIGASTRPSLQAARPGRRRRRWPWVAGGAAAVAAAALAAAHFAWPSGTVRVNADGLPQVGSSRLAGRVVRVTVRTRDGKAVPVVGRLDGTVAPAHPVTAGTQFVAVVVFRRPGWIGWIAGHTQTKRVEFVAPAARLEATFLRVARGAPVIVTFDRPVREVRVTGMRPARTIRPVRPTHTIVLGRLGTAGSVRVSAVALEWERLPPPTSVTWFPPGRQAMLLTSPRPGAQLAARTDLRLRFSEPVAGLLHGRMPALTPRVAGRWRMVDGHTLEFRPRGYGFGLGGRVKLSLPVPVKPIGGAGKPTHTIVWTTTEASEVRLEEMLALLRYLPLRWTADDADATRTLSGQLAAALDPPAGKYTWRYPNVPPELVRLWQPGRYNAIVRGAVMAFQNEHQLTVDGFAGRDVWQALIADVIAGKPRAGGYSYVFVHSTVPQSLNLWHDGRVILSSPGNTGVPAAPTQLGTFPVFEHIPVGTMSGTNPDGSHYRDPGVRWISYFNAGEGIHAFNRSSFGTPQSLGCVELPLAAAAKVWPYTPIGTLVTVEK